MLQIRAFDEGTGLYAPWISTILEQCWPEQKIQIWEIRDGQIIYLRIRSVFGTHQMPSVGICVKGLWQLPGAKWEESGVWGADPSY